MSALYITVFVSFVLVALAVVAFMHTRVNGDGDHMDRLALLPLEPDDIDLPPTLPTSEEDHDCD